MQEPKLLELLQQVKKYYANEGFNIIGFFGSYARNEAREDSDIDIFVHMKPSFFKLVGLKQHIEEDLKKKVDMIRKHKHIKPILLQMIEKDIHYV